MKCLEMPAAVRRAARGAVIAGVLASAVAAGAWAQNDGDPVAVGTYRLLHSQILNEDRVLQVHLPWGYASTDAAYPVVYLFYSDWVDGYFAQVVNDLYHLSMDQIPPMILVGVANTQRYRDLLPWPRSADRPNEGQADRFLRAVREEIIPFIETEYRTVPYRVMIGPQAAAAFGAYALLEAPDLFQAFVLNDPCGFDPPGRSLCGDVAAFASSPAARGKYFAVSNDAGDESRGAEGLASLATALEADAVDGFRWRIDLEEDWPFFLAPVAVRPALMDLFREYPLPSLEDVRGWPEIQSHYARFSRSLGFTADPPANILTLISTRLTEQGEYPAALEVLQRLVDIHPQSLNGPWGLANLYRVMGDTASAIRYYEECLRRDPSITPARQWLERLRGRQ